MNLIDNVIADNSENSSQTNITSSLQSNHFDKISFEWNDTHSSYPRNKTIKELFEAQVNRSRDTIAFIYNDKKLTYNELNTRANQLAHRLMKSGIKPGDFVGMCFERSLEMMISLNAIVKTGAAYLPLDPSFPEERLSFIIQDSGLKILITKKEYEQTFKQKEIIKIYFDIDDEKFLNEPEENPDLKFSPETPAYVIYTSGSTGKPKGVLGTNLGIVNRVFWEYKTFPYLKDDICSQRVSISFVGAVAEIFAPLLFGITSVLIPNETIKDVDKLVNFLHEKKITRIIMVPSLLRRILYSELYIEKKLSNVNLWSCSGEALTTDVCNKFLEIFPRSILLNRYGPTETASDATFYKITEPIKSINVPIGKPISNIQIYILDELLNLVAPGVAGELYIGGDGLAIGYLNRSELTKEKFIPNSFSKEKTSKLYKSGDKARYLEDGNIEFLGRIDNQINIRGFRIEPGEIEYQLMKHDYIKQAVVVATDDNLDEKKIISYIVSEKNSVLTPSELRKFLSAKLPEYMVPSAFVFLDEPPLTPNGKIDRLALSLLEVKRDSLKDFEEPVNEIEKEVQKIWKDVLKLDTIGINDNFFELGGHSLLATQVISRIRREFEIEMSLVSGFESPTIKELSNKINILKNGNKKSQTSVIKKISRKVKIPLSYAQIRMWFLDQLEPGNPFYNISQSIKIEGNLDINLLRNSIDKIISRHESLRTTFKKVGDEPFQSILPELKSDLKFIDLSSLSVEEQITKIGEHSKEDARKTFNIEKDILFRTSLLRLDEQTHILFLTMHHIISDEWSLGNLYRELGNIYDDLKSKGECSLPELAIQYADYSVWQREWLQDDILEKQLSFWKNELSGELPVLNLPIDKHRSSIQSYNGNNKYFFISKELTGKLDEICKEQNVTLYMILLAAFYAFLHRYTGQNDIIVGSPIAGRNRMETEDMIGFFVNTLSLRINISSNPKFTELLKTVRRNALNAYEHQDLPFEKLVEEIHPVRDISRSPVFQVMLNLLNTPTTSMKFSEFELTPIHFESGTSKFDLTLEIQELSGELKCWFEYNTDLFEEDTMKRMVKNFITLLNGIVKNPELKVSELPVLSSEEKNKILFDWNNTNQNYNLDTTIHKLFEEQVKLTPDAIAVKFENEAFTFNELNIKANQLAHYLNSNGVGIESIVGVCLERSLMMVVGILGILKAGGLYLSIDPEYPSERLDYMLRDSKTSVLLTDKKIFSKFSEREFKAIFINESWEYIANQSKKNIELDIKPENGAYIIYTSGSTGKPKGVIGLHKGAVNRFMWMWETFPFQENEVCCQKTSLSFVDSIWEIFGPLLKGIPTIYIDDSVVKDPNLLIKTLAKEKVTRIVLVPSLLRIILNYRSDLINELPELKYWITSGEALSRELMQDFYNKLPDRILLNLYGSSEVTADATYYSTRQYDLSKPVSIGKPISNNQVYILDNYLNSVPIGVAGEIFVGGAGVAKGYLYRDDLTSEKFIKNVLIENKKDKLFKTGDIGKYTADGNIIFIGRVDQQVKIRGFRIELGEIESVIKEHANVKECAVIAKDYGKEEKKIIAFIVSKNSPEASANELRNFIGKKLPEYMIPSSFEFLPKLPLTTSGKLDRKALANFEPVNMESVLTFVPPRDELDLQLIKIWENVLNINNIGIRNNFFEIGGHSLLAVSIFSQIEKRLGKQLPLAILFHAQTIEKLSDVIKESGYESHWSSLVPIQTKGTQPPFFCVHGGAGNILFCYDLATMLGDDQPFYGLQSLGLDRSVPPYASVEEMAEYYLKEIKTIQPEGPYYLSGNCFGGLVTYEIAQRLTKAGEEVKLCLLIETYVPTDTNLKKSIVKKMLDDFTEKGIIVITKKFIWKIFYKLFKAIDKPLPKAFRSVTIANQYAYNHYKPEFYPGKLILFIASNSPYWEFNDKNFGWGNYTNKEISVYRVPGGHLTVFNNKNINGLVESLKDVLEKAKQ